MSEVEAIRQWSEDWNLFIKEVLGVTLDKEQQAIVTSVQHNSRTSVVSGTARGKDFVAACIAISFLYLTPLWNSKGELEENTKVILSAPSDMQVRNIMMAEISRLWAKAKNRGFDLPGTLNTMDIRTNDKEWYLLGFKSDDTSVERWTGFHAANILFVITEATGISETIFESIEGNLQGNSRILLVFNYNTTVGYAARSQKSEKWAKFKLSSLTAPNIKAKKDVIKGQVNYRWLIDVLHDNCEVISYKDIKTEENDFCFENVWYRPNDWFRVKVLAEPPKVSEDTLIPQSWVEMAQKRWSSQNVVNIQTKQLGVDIAGMGRDSSVLCHRSENIVSKFDKHNSGGKADHMAVSGKVKDVLDKNKNAIAFIDTIGEGAGVYSRLDEQNVKNIVSAKYSEAAKDRNGKLLTDITGQFTFANMRAYLFWAVRDWLNPKNGYNPVLPPGGSFLEEATEIKWSFRSDGKIIIEKKEDIKKRLGKSTDEFDALANTFYPVPPEPQNLYNVLGQFA